MLHRRMVAGAHLLLETTADAIACDILAYPSVSSFSPAGRASQLHSRSARWFKF